MARRYWWTSEGRRAPVLSVSKDGWWQGRKGRGLKPWLWHLLAQQGPDVTACFSAYYTQLQALPRRTRRALQHHYGRARTARRLLAHGMRPTTSLAALALLFALGQGPAQAATFTVTNLNDAGAGSLRAAIEAADALAGADIIDFQAALSGTITLTTGQLGVNDSVDIQGPGAGVITISGNNNSRVFSVYNYTSTIDVTISGLTITNGSTGNYGGGVYNGQNLTLQSVTITGNTADDGGGGVNNNRGTITITDSTISGNTADEDAGGLYNYGGTVTLSNTQITGNTAGDDAGGVGNFAGGTLIVTAGSTIANNVAGDYAGGVDNYGGEDHLFSGTITITNSTVSGNTAEEGAGGIYNDASLTITNSTITGNTAGDDGGGLFNNGTATLTNSTITGNTAGDDGGGIFNVEGGILSVIGSSITNNLANGFDEEEEEPEGEGGGLFNVDGGTAILTNSTITGNTATDDGGGVATFRSTLEVIASTIANNSAGDYGGGVATDENTLTITNSTISGNTAGGGGGGVDNFDESTLTITNSTISGNTAGEGGGGVDNSSDDLILSRSLISGNTAPSGAEVLNDNDTGTITAADFNFFGHAGLSNATAFSGFLPSGSDINATTDGINMPLTAILDTTLQNNSGPTDTHALVAGSPAINASPADEACEETDQRGVTRPQPIGGLCDIGAYESSCGDGIVDTAISEQCDPGLVSGDCCTDTCVLAAELTACGDTSDTACDNPNTCNASGVCQPNLEPSGTECRGPAGLCDVAESCDGTNPACPEDAFVAGGTQCRGAEGVCDVAESCTGDSAACPEDAFAPATTVCRPEAGECDVAESCTGTAANCPTDAVEPSGTACSADPTACTQDICDGTNVECTHPPVAASTGCLVNGKFNQPCQGTAGIDTILGSPNADVIRGGGGTDIIDGLTGNDVVCGDEGNDILRGGPGVDRLDGGPGNDSLDGGFGFDALDGGPGTDTLNGGVQGATCVNGETNILCTPL